jgi:hypothetical protein
LDEARFERAIRSHEGFLELAFNPVSKSLLIAYETGHLTTEEILLRSAIALSMEYDYQPIQVDLGAEQEAMTDGAILAGLVLLASAALQVASRNASPWYARTGGLAVAAAVAEHGWREARDHGYVHPEILSVGYLFASWLKGNTLRGATVTWFASFGRHLIQGPQKCIDVRPIGTHGREKTYKVSLVPETHRNSPLLRWAQGILGVFGLGGFGGSGDSLYEEIKSMAQAHDKVMEGLELQPDGIPLTFTKEL